MLLVQMELLGSFNFWNGKYIEIYSGYQLSSSMMWFLHVLTMMNIEFYICFSNEIC